MLLNVEQPHKDGLRFGALTEVIATVPTALASLPTDFGRGQAPFPLSFQGYLNCWSQLWFKSKNIT